MIAIVMAGGFGTRMRPLTCNVPKPMLPVANRPVMEHGLRLLKKHGFTDVRADPLTFGIVYLYTGRKL